MVDLLAMYITHVFQCSSPLPNWDISRCRTCPFFTGKGNMPVPGIAEPSPKNLNCKHLLRGAECLADPSIDTSQGWTSPLYRVYMNGNASIYGWQKIFHNMDISAFIYMEIFYIWTYMYIYIYIIYITIHITIYIYYIVIYYIANISLFCCVLPSKK